LAFNHILHEDHPLPHRFQRPCGQGRSGASAFLNPSIAEALANQSPLPTLSLRLG